MHYHDYIALLAVVLCALAVLPGTLGILMLTNKIAVSEAGARYIYGKSFWVLILSAVLGVWAAWAANADGRLDSWMMIGAGLGYAGILVFGFFMHTRLMFRPVKKPGFLTARQALATFGPDEEVVGVIDAAGTPWAFIARLARRPHIVYQPAGEHPFIMTHCILAHSSMAYAMADRFRQPEITITAALANNMVFYEKSNQCTVIQLHNRSLDGSLPLATMPTIALSLKRWAELYPDSKVWFRKIEWRDIFYLKLLARADVIDPKSPVMIYPLQHDKDERLGLKEQVIGVQIEDATWTCRLDSCKAERLIEDQVGGVSVLVVSDADGDFVQVYDRELDGRTLTFRCAEGDGFIDNETGSQWSITGRCTAGELAGKRLRPVPHYNKIFWYVWSDFHPGTRIYGATDKQKSAA